MATEPPDWVSANKGKAKEAFERAGKGAGAEAGPNHPVPPRTPIAQRNFEMPGPAGNEVRRSVAAQQAIERAKRIEAQKVQAGQEKQHENASKNRQTENDRSKESALDRAKKLELAKEFNNKSKYKGGPEVG